MQIFEFGEFLSACRKIRSQEKETAVFSFPLGLFFTKIPLRLNTREGFFPGINSISFLGNPVYWMAAFFTCARAFATAGIEMTTMVITPSASRKL